MSKKLPKILLFSLFVVVFLFSSIFNKAHAQLNGCGEIDMGNPDANQPPPPQCQTNKNISCTNVSVINNLPYTYHTGINSLVNISVTVWACDHAAPLVLFVPGRGRDANDYARYENAIAKEGF